MVKCAHWCPFAHLGYSWSITLCLLSSVFVTSISCRRFENLFFSRVICAWGSSGDGQVKVNSGGAHMCFHFYFTVCLNTLKRKTISMTFLLFLHLHALHFFSEAVVDVPWKQKCWTVAAVLKAVLWRVRHRNDQCSFALFMAASLCTKLASSV